MERIDDLQAALASLSMMEGYNGPDGQDLTNATAATNAAEQASRTLFLGDLSYFCKEDDLCALFAGYGPILAVSVRRGVTGESLMHGFVALESAESARRVIADMNGMEFMGRNLK